MNELADLVFKAKTDAQAMNEVIERMSPLINSFCKKLFFLDKEDARQELILAIIEAVYRIRNCKYDGSCITFMQNAVYYKFCKLCKNNIYKNNFEVSIDDKVWDNQETLDYSINVNSKIDFEILLRKLPETQKQICLYLLEGYSDREIGNRLNLSRQYVNRIKKNINLPL